VARIMAKKDAPKVMEALRAHPSGLTRKEISKLPTGRPRADTRWEATQGGGQNTAWLMDRTHCGFPHGVPPEKSRSRNHQSLPPSPRRSGKPLPLPMRAVVLWCSPPTRKALRESLCVPTRARRITIPQL
jgi:hypothetical protein